MADYRHDCCGGFPGHSDECRARGAERLKVAKARDAMLDKMYAIYGELQSKLARSTSDHNKGVYGAQADGLLMAIRIVEGKDDVIEA